MRSRCRGKVCPVADEAGNSKKTMCETNRIENLAEEGDGPVVERALSVDRFSQVVRDSRNPVRIRPDRWISLNISI